MTVNLHTHTYRCGHASGTEREYIERALANGITHMGFSDHVPFRYPDGTEAKFRVPVAEAQNYMDTLRALQEEYRGRMSIYIGFEMEYFPLYFQDMLRFVQELGAEYLILGQHLIGNGQSGEQHVTKPSLSEERLTEYADTVVEGIRSGVFTYVAHPDVFNFWGADDVYDAQMRKICRASVQCDIPLEINFLGLRDGRQYPNARLWEIAGEEGCKAVFGFDAHKTKHAYDGDTIPLAEWMIRQYGLRYEPYPCLIDPKTKKRRAILPDPEESTEKT